MRVVLRPAAASSLSGPLRFIVDSGSSFDIANMKECTRGSLARVVGLNPPLKMCTVNGNVTVANGLRIEVPALRKGLRFALMPHSPSIISLGRRCMLDGYAFHWPRLQTPYLIDPNGQRIELEVGNFVPYISSVPRNVANPNGTTGVPPPPAMASEDVEPVEFDPDARSSNSAEPVIDRVDSVEPKQTSWPKAEEEVESSGGSSAEEYELATTPEREKELRRIARSTEHGMTHLPKNAYCKWCQRA